VQTPLDVVQVAVAGQFEAVGATAGHADPRDLGQQLRLGDIAEIKRGYADPPVVKVRHQGKEVIALGVSMAKGGDIIRLGESLSRCSIGSRTGLPAGIKLVQIQTSRVRFPTPSTNSCARSSRPVLIVLAVSFIALGCTNAPMRPCLPLWKRYYVEHAAGPGGGHHDPPGAGRCTFLAMDYWGIGLHKISLVR
jgi:multidrug efflux pump subunit AcrB